MNPAGVCCPQSPLFELYPGRPMEQTFFYTREGIPKLPPSSGNLMPQIAEDHTWPRPGSSAIKMAAVDPDLQLAYPEEWWIVPRENFTSIPPDSQVSRRRPRRKRKRSPSRPTCVIIGLLVVVIGIWLLPTRTPA